MIASLRALRALVLLGGFYLMGVVLLAALLAADWLLLSSVLVNRSPYLMLGVVFASVMLAVPVLRGMFAFLPAGRRSSGPEGLAVTPEAQPTLWAEVREAARKACTAEPDALLLTADVNAAVTERARLLGLLAGPRSLYLGVPLLTGLTAPELRAVLAHEFGHFSNQDTRLAGITMRGRAAVLHTVDAFRAHDSRAHAVIGNLYVHYARFFLTATQSSARQQELAADRAAARHTGRDTTASALRRVPLLGAAHDHYIDAYATLGVPAHALPSVGEFHGGFRHLLAARSPEALTELAGSRGTPRPTPYDSHPPMSERLALIEALPSDGATHDPAATPALSLLHDRHGVLAALESYTLPAAAAGMRRLEWPELVMARSVVDASGWADPLSTAVRRALRSAALPGRAGPSTSGSAEGTSGRPDTSDVDATDSRACGIPGPDVEDGGSDLPGLDDVLDAIDAGLLWMEVADRMPKPARASRLTGRSARNFIRPALWDGLAGLVYLRLVEEKTAHPDVSWSGEAGLVLPEEWEKGMDSAIDAAVADTPDTKPLRRLLAGGGRASE
ncbi:M48 family metallopeptidase [Streptomyces sp. NPDC004074]|uniref:M48 family metallopeptidase n=1 Tax=Streptomyces sp. NPDC004074 TaxID=3154277 RepID=UPI0033B3DE23